MTEATLKQQRRNGHATKMKKTEGHGVWWLSRELLRQYGNPRRIPNSVRTQSTYVLCTGCITQSMIFRSSWVYNKFNLFSRLFELRGGCPVHSSSSSSGSGSCCCCCEYLYFVCWTSTVDSSIAVIYIYSLSSVYYDKVEQNIMRISGYAIGHYLPHFIADALINLTLWNHSGNNRVRSSFLNLTK